MPTFLDFELPSRRGLQDLEGAPEGYRVRYRRSGWTVYAWAGSGVKSRKTAAWIEQDARQVGVIAFHEFQAKRYLQPFEFWQPMDSITSEDAVLAEVLCSEWDDPCIEVFDWGHVVDLRTIWIEPRRHKPGFWLPIAERLIDEVSEGCAILMIHAFPFEYSGLLKDGALANVGFERRQRAMIEFCKRRWGMRPFPGDPGADGWLWRPRQGLEGIIGEPEYDPDWMKEA
jgi:hypothetical protein